MVFPEETYPSNKQGEQKSSSDELGDTCESGNKQVQVRQIFVTVVSPHLIYSKTLGIFWKGLINISIGNTCWPKYNIVVDEVIQQKQKSNPSSGGAAEKCLCN